MAKDQRKQTGFRCDAELLKAFQKALIDKDQDMSPVIEGWIGEFMAGGKVPAGQAMEVTCPVCRSELDLHTPGEVRVLSTPKVSMEASVPEDHKVLVSKFLGFMADPEGDDHVRDFILKVLGKI